MDEQRSHREYLERQAERRRLLLGKVTDVRPPGDITAPITTVTIPPAPEPRQPWAMPGFPVGWGRFKTWLFRRLFGPISEGDKVLLFGRLFGQVERTLVEPLMAEDPDVRDLRMEAAAFRERQRGDGQERDSAREPRVALRVGSPEALRRAPPSDYWP